VAIDTIEVQDVRVLSEDVFAKLQAPFREVLAREALEAEATVEARRAAQDGVSAERLQELLYTVTLPEVARAYADSFESIVVTGASDLSVLGQGVGQVVATLQALGVGLPGGHRA